jgi:hypothetical protein
MRFLFQLWEVFDATVRLSDHSRRLSDLIKYPLCHCVRDKQKILERGVDALEKERAISAA